MTIIDTTNQRAEYVAGLRALADALETHPELILPYHGSGTAIAVYPMGAGREQLAAWTRAIPGRKHKQQRNNYLDLVGAFRGLKIEVTCDRDGVCEKIVTGTREVTETVPDPELVAAVPLIERTRTEEIVEWVCLPLLGDRDIELAPVGAR